MDEFTPAQVGTTDPVPPAPPPPASDKAPETHPLVEIAIMAEEVAQAIAHVGTMIPSLSPLMAAANRIKMQAARLRLVIDPAPPEGPEPDHS